MYFSVSQFEGNGFFGVTGVGAHGQPCFGVRLEVRDVHLESSTRICRFRGCATISQVTFRFSGRARRSTSSCLVSWRSALSLGHTWGSTDSPPNSAGPSAHARLNSRRARATTQDVLSLVLRQWGNYPSPRSVGHRLGLRSGLNTLMNRPALRRSGNDRADLRSRQGGGGGGAILLFLRGPCPGASYVPARRAMLVRAPWSPFVRSSIWLAE